MATLDPKLKRHRILFSPAMVRAFKAGEKFETRRMKKLEQINKHPNEWHLASVVDNVATFDNSSLNLSKKVNIPYKPGEVCSFAENFHMEAKWDHLAPVGIIRSCRSNPEEFGNVEDLKIWWPADETPKPDWAGRKRIGMFMPGALARLESLIVQVKVERLQEITNQDAIREGVLHWARDHSAVDRLFSYSLNHCEEVFLNHIWNPINPDNPASSNPWVWVLKLTPHEG